MSQLVQEAFDPAGVLAPLRRSIGLRQLGQGAVRGLAVGGAAGLLPLVVNHAHQIPLATGTALLALAAGLLVGLLWAVRRWPSDLDAARAADRHFELHDRLTTALELRAARTPLAALQRSDAARRIAGLSLKESSPRRFSWREGTAAFVVLILGAVLLAVSPPAPRFARAAPSSDATRIHRAAVAVPSLIHRLEHNLTPAQRRNVAARRLQQVLKRLQRQLRHASTRAAALRAISATQQQLHRIASTLHPISPHATSQLNRVLGPSRATPHSTNSSNHAAAQAAAALSRLARSLSHLNTSQRRALARRLAQAANAVSDKTLRAALQQTASSLAYNDPQTASASLQRAAGALAQSAGSQAAQSQVNAAAAQLDGLKGQVSGIDAPGGTGAAGAGTPGGQGSGAGSSKGVGKASGSGQGAGTGTGQGKGSGRGSGAGKGNGAGQGRGTGQGKGSGQGSGSGSGSGGTGGHGAGGGRGGSGPRGQGKYTTVYAPQHQGKGPQTVQTGPNGQPLPGSFVPYQQVIQRYAASAHQALSQSPLPPSLQGYVRRYFSTISH